MEAKHRGGHQLELYSSSLRQRVSERLGLEPELASALQVQSRQVSVSSQILEVIHRYQLDPAWVEFEINETAVQDDPEAITKQFDVLEAAGSR